MSEITSDFFIEWVKLIDTPPFVRKQKYTNNISAEDWLKLINEYTLFDIELKEKAQLCIDSYSKKTTSFNTKTCPCGGKLRYISSHDFWGCENYKDESKKHFSFSGHTPNIYSDYFNVSSNWVTDIINKVGLDGKINAKRVFEYFIENGLEDLRLKYKKLPTEKQINSLIETKERSKIQEQKALEYLKTKYEKVVPQQCILFKLTGSKEEFCIPDFICSDKNKVTIVDAKLDYTNDSKMTKYILLVRHILRKNKDDRIVTGAHIMYSYEQQYNQTAYPVIILPQ